MELITNHWEILTKFGVAILGAILIGLLVHFVLYRIGNRLSSRTETIIDNAMLKHFRRPLLLVLPMLFLHFVIPVYRTSIPEAIAGGISVLANILFTIGIAWVLVKAVYVLEEVLLSEFRVDVQDNLKARKIHTQMQLVKKIVTVLVGILALATILMNFERFRELGTGILASAGLAGIIIGFSAQKTLANLLAGIQIAITQPIRLDDVVIVEGEWGWIEEITLTYVIVRIWDLRRLVVPISNFLDKPFQNWTRESADILGTVFLYVDYTVPIDEIRQELQRLLENSEYWDGKVCRLHTTNATDKSVELRALMSAKDSPSAWELRCEVREKLIDFVQNNYPEGLPKVRAELGSQPEIERSDLENQGESLSG
ncbi:MAG: mechanosensitive ion channel family protein [Candidatus Marinimicrobia bacterium]|nr:mechanosensitive ion channel family protein [Candidatus Neomarinimicrobiota bacterium]MCF7830061.1 mechanosensitive ion channel family protein [Candidatus Neomarinimicrobiota bacterium]MCF7882362.1 mechanosensitive ion channel family protein [Candidatus Neomarinimicrobiota bacterium]